MENGAANNPASNIKHLRDARNFTQQQLAKVSGVPRPTVANLESGAANPTLGVLVKVAAALQVSIEELIAAPRAAAKLYPRGALPSRTRGQVLVHKLLPDKIVGMEIERLQLPAGARMTGVPHTPGTREYLTCEAGEIELTASGETWQLKPGDVVAFRGDQNHSYANRARKVAVAYSVVVLAPPTL